jgi:predicted dehydrogenase
MPISISLLGCAHPHLAGMLAVIAGEGDLRLGAAWDPDPTAVPGVIASHAVVDLDVAIARADAVVVAVPADQRPGTCLRAARSGRPVLVEPPLARTAGESRAAARELQRTRTPVHTVLFLRELPSLARLRAALAGGVLGRVAGASGGFLSPRALDDSLRGPAAWMLDPRRSGVGGFGELATHLVDAFALLGAPPQLDALSLDRGPLAGAELGGAALGSWAGVPLSVRASWVSRPARLELTIDGSRASAQLRDGTLELIAGAGAGERWIGAPPDPGESLRAFVERLRRRALPRDGLAAAIRAQEALERATRVG